MTKPTKRRNAPLDRTARPRDGALVIATEIQKLAADFEVAAKEDLSVQSNTGDDAEMMAAFNRASELAEKILGLPTSTDLSITRLRAAAYLWARAQTIEEISEEAEATDEKILVSLLRDLTANAETLPRSPMFTSAASGDADRVLAQDEEAAR